VAPVMVQQAPSTALRRHFDMTSAWTRVFHLRAHLSFSRQRLFRLRVAVSRWWYGGTLHPCIPDSSHRFRDVGHKTVGKRPLGVSWPLFAFQVGHACCGRLPD
jgi:hypothetical protein